MKIKTTREGATTERIAQSWEAKAVGDGGDIVMLGFAATFDGERVDVLLPMLPGQALKLCEMLQRAIVGLEPEGG